MSLIYNIQLRQHITDAEQAIERAEYHIRCVKHVTRKVLVNHRIDLAKYHITRARIQLAIARLHKEKTYE